jgi:hypothetical protein
MRPMDSPPEHMGQHPAMLGYRDILLTPSLF